MSSNPIYVDLDGTITRTDLFVESLIACIRLSPLRLFLIPFWILRGLPVAKMLAARHGHINVETLPYDWELIAYLREQKKRGRRIYLATAAHRKLARRVARHLILFDGVLASDVRKNLKGAEKLKGITGNERGADFVYAGDSAADGPIWSAASAGIFVRAPARHIVRATASGKVERVFPRSERIAGSMLRSLRPHQWSKNGLLFLPLLAAHQYADPASLGAALLGFFAFSLCASSAYLLNDVMDLEADRQHFRKKSRPMASGALPVMYGAILSPLLLFIAFAASFAFLPMAFAAVLFAYYLTTCLYSFWLKRIAAVDVMTLAGLYTCRVIGGAAAISVAPTFWLLAFSMFLFLSLAYVKRYTELRLSSGASGQRIVGRGYALEDTESTYILGSVSGVAAVLVMALYVNSPEVRVHYAVPEFLWGLCVALLYWINRIWIGARRGKIHDDPVVFALTDRVSIAAGAFCLACILLARFSHW